MYLARFEDESGGLVMGAARWVGGNRSADLDTLLGAEPGVSGAGFALRTQLTEGRLERVLLVNGPAASEPALRKLFERLSSELGSDVELCGDKSRHDRVAAAFPAPRRGWMRPGGYRAGAFRLASDFRLFSVVDAVFAAARSQPWNVAYQVNVRRAEPSTEDLRWLRKQLVRIELDSRVPPDVLALQRAIVNRFGDTTHELDEIVGCGEPASWDFLQRVADDEFAVRMKRYRFSSSPLEAGDPALLGELVETGFQLELLEPGDAVTRAAAAARTRDVAAIARWSPAPAKPVGAPRAAAAAADVFISYSSRNRGVAETVCGALERRGIGCWIAPRDVAAGESYPRAILHGLAGCRVVVLVFSSDSNASPHVEREVERAVSKRIPIVNLRLDAAPPSASLEYLVSLSQWIDATPSLRDEHLAELAGCVSRLLGRDGAGATRGGS